MSSSNLHNSDSKKLIHVDVLLSTILTFVIIGLLGLVFFNVKYLNPFAQALKDFQYTDLYYSQFVSQKTVIDENIVIVNVGENGRLGIAEQIAVVRANNPSVIVLDVTFVEKKEEFTDSLLKEVLHGDIPIVVTKNIVYDEQGSFSIERAHSYFEIEESEAYGNFLAKDMTAIRYFTPFVEHEGAQYVSLAAKAVKHHNEEAYKRLLARGKKHEIINYRSNDYIRLDADMIDSQNDLSILNGKIVMMGYLGPDLYTKVFLDNHLTPLNKSFGGKSLPDKYGIEIHANILSMILDDNYINEAPKWLNYLLAFLICAAHMYFFIWLFVYQHKWFHLGAKVLQLVSFFALVIVCLMGYHYASFKLEPSYMALGVLLSVDALYFYEAITVWLNRKFGFDSLFLHHH